MKKKCENCGHSIIQIAPDIWKHRNIGHKTGISEECWIDEHKYEQAGKIHYSKKFGCGCFEAQPSKPKGAG